MNVRQLMKETQIPDRTAVEITEWERHKAMYRKMGINIEGVYKRQAWEEIRPIAIALGRQEALKTVTVIKVTKAEVPE